MESVGGVKNVNGGSVQMDKMKFAITGHTNGIGKAFSELPEVKDNFIGFSKSTGYNIEDVEDRSKIIEESIDCDVFINNAYASYYQTDLLYELHKKWKDSRSASIQNVTSKDDELLYKAALRYLGENDIFMQRADVDDSELRVVFSQSKFRSFPLAVGRVTNILDQISPPKITKFEMTNVNANMPLHSITIDRDLYKTYDPIHATGALLTRSSVDAVHNTDLDDFEFIPNAKLPQLFYSFNPNLRTQIGGPDGFFFGDLTLTMDSELIIKKNFTLSTQLSASLADNFEELKLASDSILPQVRTDIVSYLKETRGNVYLERMQFNYFSKLSKNIYGKISWNCDGPNTIH